MTQAEVAEAIGRTQTQVSKYALGRVQPDIDVIYAIEKACGRRPGWILTAAGYVEPALDVGTALAMDSSLSVEGQRALMAAYDTFAGRR